MFSKLKKNERKIKLNGLMCLRCKQDFRDNDLRYLVITTKLIL